MFNTLKKFNLASDKAQMCILSITYLTIFQKLYGNNVVITELCNQTQYDHITFEKL